MTKKVYRRDEYTLTAFTDDTYRLEIFNPKTGNLEDISEKDILKAMLRAKMEAESGKEVEIWELKYRYKP